MSRPERADCTVDDIVGVVGAGVIGVGVVESLAVAGHTVILIDLSEERLEAATTQLLANLRMARLLGHDYGGESASAPLGRVRPALSYQPLNGASFVIENVVERGHVKKAGYEQLDAGCPPQCVFAANTSAIPIGHIAAATQRPDRMLGIHFMNPVPYKQTVEVIRGPDTTQDTLTRTERLLARMGKQ